MIIIAGTFAIHPEDAAAMKAAASVMMLATQQEDGCLEYVFSEDLTNANEVKLFERWASDQALAAHFEVDHMQTFRASLAGLRVERRAVQIWRDINEGEPLS